mgnify:CR=1 FL=1
MSLPEPNFIERDPEKILQELISFYEQMTGKKLYPAQIERLLIDLIAYREMLIRIAIQEAAKQNLLAYARFPMLDYLGELLGVTRLPAQPARTTLRFTLSQALSFDLLIPKGTQVKTKDGKYIFETDSDLTIRAGELWGDVRATCTVAGAGANGYIAGEVNSLLSPLPYIERVENISVTYGGADEEDDERFRERIRKAPERFSVAGPKLAYRFWAMTAHQDIVDVAVLSPSPGMVSIYPLMRDGAPSPEVLQLVSKVVNDERVRPLTDYVQVLPPVRVDFSIEARLTLYRDVDSRIIQKICEEKVRQYLSKMKSRLGMDIVRTQIIALLNSVSGVYKCDLISPAQDRALAENEWANCTGYTITIVGSVDG